MVRTFSTRLIAATALLTLGLLAAPLIRADEEYNQAPIRYKQSKPHDAIARLQEELNQGKLKLDADPQRGYLTSLLKALKIPVESQTLVFSKTSFHARLISPQRPRAIYFSDDVYVGWVQGADTLEIAATDPQLGTVFYTLDQETAIKPRFVRQTDSCLQCHDSSVTRNVPGLMVRSVFTDRTGQPVLSAGTFISTHESPLKNRFGGWYVSGTHGNQRHMGNTMLDGSSDPNAFDRDSGANVTDLDKLFDTSPYLTPHSDLVALMVLDHQAEAHNRIERANYQTRTALRDAAILNEALHEKPDHLSDSTVSRINHSGEPLVKYLLFCEEPALIEPIEGSSRFAKGFSAQGPRDHLGRSLRDFDLKTRLFKYPCSYLIYSEGFDALPAEVKEYVYHRLWEILTGKDTSTDFSHLSAADRRAILEILCETKPGLPKYWKP